MKRTITGLLRTSKRKKPSASGGASPPWPPTGDSAPWTPLGALPPDPRYRLALPRSPCPALKPPILEFNYFYKNTVISGARRDTVFGDFVTIMSAHAQYCVNLLPIVNLSPKMDSVTSFSHMARKVLAVRRCFWLILATFHCACAVSKSYYYFRFKIWRHIWIQRDRFPSKTRSLKASDTIFGDFCNDNVCVYFLNYTIKIKKPKKLNWAFDVF